MKKFTIISSLLLATWGYANLSSEYSSKVCEVIYLDTTFTDIGNVDHLRVKCGDEYTKISVKDRSNYHVGQRVNVVENRSVLGNSYSLKF